MPAPCVGCNPNAYNDNPEVGKAYKLKNNSRPWSQAAGNPPEEVVVKTIRSSRTREDYKLG